MEATISKLNEAAKTLKAEFPGLYPSAWASMHPKGGKARNRQERATHAYYLIHIALGCFSHVAACTTPRGVIRETNRAESVAAHALEVVAKI